MTDWTTFVMEFRNRLNDGESPISVPFEQADTPGLYGSLSLIADEYGYVSTHGDEKVRSPHVFSRR